MVIILEVELAIRVQILNKAVSISFHINAPPNYRKIVGQTGFFNLAW